MARTPGPDRIVLEVARLSLAAARRCVSTYGSIKSRHDFTQPQLIACLVLRAYLRTTFRGITQLLAEMPDVRAALGLERVPHYTTLQKLHAKPHVVGVIEAMLTDLLRGVTGQDRAAVEEVAMDSTGLAMTNASVYFRMVKEKDRAGKGSKKRRPARGPDQRGSTSAPAATSRSRWRWPARCSCRAPCVASALGPTPPRPPSCWSRRSGAASRAAVRRRGFDAESLHGSRRDEHGTESWVPPVIKSKDGTVKTPHRARMLDLPACYGGRWQVESFSRRAQADHRREPELPTPRVAAVRGRHAGAGLHRPSVVPARDSKGVYRALRTAMSPFQQSRMGRANQPTLSEEALRRREEVEWWVARQMWAHGHLFSNEIAPPCGTPYSVLSAAMERGRLDFGTPEFEQLFGSACDHVVRERRARVESAAASTRAHEPSRGRWLLFQPNRADFCQLAHDPGFVDESDAPAWDLWVCWTTRPTGGVLVSWVPEALVDRFNAATLCSPCDTVAWADEDALGAEFVSRLLREGISS
ncbi:MAG: hypothetical protein R3B68_16395 [Phycisphaerales bacterium]